MATFPKAPRFETQFSSKIPRSANYTGLFTATAISGTNTTFNCFNNGNDQFVEQDSPTSLCDPRSDAGHTPFPLKSSCNSALMVQILGYFSNFGPGWACTIEGDCQIVEGETWFERPIDRESADGIGASRIWRHRIMRSVSHVLVAPKSFRMENPLDTNSFYCKMKLVHKSNTSYLM